jgi:hypothetical protein
MNATGPLFFLFRGPRSLLHMLKPVVGTVCRVALLCLLGCGPQKTPGNVDGPFVPPVVAEPSIPSFEALVTDFGATPNDGTDDTLAIQRGLDAVNATGGGTLVFPAGRFDIAINPQKNHALTVYTTMRLEGRPAGAATLRLANGQITYDAILSAATYPTRLDDFELKGLTIDSNSTENPVRDYLETQGETAGPTFRFSFRAYVGSRLAVRACTFVNIDNGNTLSFNGDDVSDVLIENSVFSNVGGVLVDHDHSTIYAFANRVRIINNQFKSRFGAGTIGARTAIETHFTNVEVRGNVVEGYLQGANIVGRTNAFSRQLYVNNTIRGVALGLNIWPLQEELIAQGPAFDELLIRDNEIHVDVSAWWPSKGMVIVAPAGIAFEVDRAIAPIARLEISDNRITFDSFVGKSLEPDKVTAGIRLVGVENRMVVQSLSVSNNVIVDAVGPGLLSTVALGGQVASQIANNTLTNCGRGANLVGPGDTFRSGVVLGGRTQNIALQDNSVATTTSPSSTLIGFVLASPCSGNCTVRTNSFSGLKEETQLIGTGWVQTSK